ncbi:MAG: glycosyltransferase [Actinobacteria bacterium]|nr:glycosyltransferase [Actinomycetota bacterium]
MRIGIYMDFVYAADAEGVSTDQAVVLFALQLGPRIGEVVLFGRLAPEPGRAPYPVGGPHVRFVALPHYRALTDLAALLRAIRRSCAVFSAQLDDLDAVWLFTPSPLSLLFAAIARRRGVAVIFGLRQDTPQYLAHRLPSRRWIWVLPFAHALDRLHRLLAGRVPTTVVGPDLARKFGADRKPVLEMSVSLVRRADLVSLETAQAKSWAGELRVLSVGRIDPEKNPLLLADVVAELRSRDPRWLLDVAGDGPLADALRRRATELGVADAVRLHGYVASGPALQELYRDAHALVHVSLTEGLPQVLHEAHAAGLPIVATDVGGVRGALSDGSAGLLVPPRDARADAGTADVARPMARSSAATRALPLSSFEAVWDLKLQEPLFASAPRNLPAASNPAAAAAPSNSPAAMTKPASGSHQRASQAAGSHHRFTPPSPPRRCSATARAAWRPAASR